jgi:hypothetical protein
MTENDVTQRGIMVENELTKIGVGLCLKIHRILEPGLLELVKALLCVFAPLREILTICKTIVQPSNLKTSTR